MGDFLLAEVLTKEEGRKQWCFKIRGKVQNYLGSSKTTDLETAKLIDNERFASLF